MIRKLSLPITLLGGVLCAVIRILELNSGLIDPSTGFYTQPSVWRWVLYTVIAAVAVVMLIAVLTDRYLINHIYFKKTGVLGVGSALLGGYLLLHSALSFTAASLAVTDIVLAVLGIVAGVLVIIACVGQFRNQTPSELMRFSSLVVILWAIGIVAMRYTHYNVILTVEQHLIEVLLMLCGIFFLLGVAWLQFREKRKRGKRILAFFGSMTFVLGLTSSVPVIYTGLMSGVPTALVGSMAVLDLVIALYALCHVIYLSLTNR